MKELIQKYADKLVEQRIVDPGEPLIGGLDADFVWNRDSRNIESLEEIVNGLNINSILFSKPAEPYYSIINYLAKEAVKNRNYSIKPEDTETRTFLHDIPILEEFSIKKIIKTLGQKKSVYIIDKGIISFGIVSPEQAFVVFSSLCFSTYVKLFVDYYFLLKQGITIPDEYSSLIKSTMEIYSRHINSEFSIPEMKKGPFNNSEDIIEAMAEAGRLTIRSSMVDSFFGNISYLQNDIIYISQTGSSLDELEGCIDPCPVNNSSANAITASSEFSAHKSIYSLTDNMSILHGHPKFSVILSMLCDDIDCDNRGKCHINCSKERFVFDIPIIPGEVGTGPKGLSKTLPPALTGRGAIVFGHGLFTVGKTDFRDAFSNLIDIERKCLEEYKRKIDIP